MEELIEFLLRAFRLKTLGRTGRELIGIPNPESVADHTFGASIIAMVISDVLRSKGKRVNVERVLKMVLLHDVIEAVIGDIPSPAMKKGLVEVNELEAYKEALSGLPEELYSEYLEIAREFLEGKTLEAKIARLSDKLDQRLQAYKYYRVFGYETLRRFAPSDAPVIDELEDLKEHIKELFEDRYGDRIRFNSGRARSFRGGYEEVIGGTRSEARERGHGNIRHNRPHRGRELRRVIQGIERHRQNTRDRKDAHPCSREGTGYLIMSSVGM